MFKNKIKTFFKLCLLTTVVLFSGCSEQSKHQNNAKTGITGLTYWCAANPNEMKLARELVDEWNRLYPKVPVKLQPLPASQSSEEVLLAAIAGGTTPDICSNMWPGAMDDFTSSGGLVPLDTFPDFWQVVKKRVPEDMLKTFRSPDGHYYQWPWKTNPIMMVYNKKIFRRFGIKAPLTTYSQYLSAAKKIVVDSDGDGQVDYWMAYRDVKPIWWQRLFDFFPLYIGASGGKTLFNGQHLIFENEASVKVFSFMRELYKNKYLPITQFQGDQFLAGRLATQITGPWMIPYIKQYKHKGFEYGVMPLPHPDNYKGRLFTYGDPKNISVFSTTHNPKQAWKFVKWLVSARADLRLLQICSQIPIRKNLSSDNYFKAYFERHPKIIPFARQAPFTRGVDGIADLKEIFDAISHEYEACVLYGKKTPAQAIQQAAEQARVIMKWNNE